MRLISLLLPLPAIHEECVEWCLSRLARAGEEAQGLSADRELQVGVSAAPALSDLGTLEAQGRVRVPLRMQSHSVWMTATGEGRHCDRKSSHVWITHPAGCANSTG